MRTRGTRGGDGCCRTRMIVSGRCGGPFFNFSLNIGVGLGFSLQLAAKLSLAIHRVAIRIAGGAVRQRDGTWRDRVRRG